MAKVNLRVRHEGGQGVVKGLDPSDSIEKLISHCLEVLGVQEIDVDAVRMLSGFPPKALDLSDRDRNIESLGVRSGDTIILENLKPSSSTSSSTSSSSSPSPSGFAFGPALTAKSESVTDPEGATGAKRQKTEVNAARMERRVVPADNSCLFTAINYCMSGEVVPSKNSQFMREVISSVVGADLDKYSEAILGKENSSYCSWIQGKDAWGGAIEVQILAEYFQVEIAVVDTVSGSQTIFGESQSFPSLMVLIYDGIHYDPLFLRATDGSIKTVHSSKDESILPLAQSTAKEARAAHNYTDTKGFTLKCLVCGVRMKGETEAQLHAKESKHTNFSEV